MQKVGELNGLCQNYLLCAPIKSALKNEALMTRGLGHVICPYAIVNINRAKNTQLSEQQAKANYPECLTEDSF